jgi:RNA polymerase sigma-70 factor (ECF subfamily)
MKINSAEYTQFIDYYNQYKDKIFSFFYYRLDNDTQMAEDLTSDVFLKAYDNFENFDKKYAFSTWIYTIARNTLIDKFRKNKEFVELEDDQILEITTEENFSLNFDKNLKIKEIYAFLEKLPNTQKEVLILKYLDDLNTKEIAEIINSTPVNVRKLLSRGVQKLRKILILLIILCYV